ncbi:MAG: PEP/pyruvate-binding domain-containing protein, partial [Longimicrobiales bacterium]
MPAAEPSQLVTRPFQALSLADVGAVGGKNASLGELVRALGDDIVVPRGFAVAASAYWRFLDANRLRQPIEEALERPRKENADLLRVGSEIRGLIGGSEWPDDLADDIAQAYA